MFGGWGAEFTDLGMILYNLNSVKEMRKRLKQVII
jgi:hypothetical protein